MNLDVSTCMEVPDHLDRAVGVDLILDQNMAAVHHGDPAPCFSYVRCVRLRQIGNGQSALRVGMEREQPCPSPGVLVLSLDRQGIVRLGAQAVVIPSLLTEVARQVVIVAAEIQGPALTQFVKNEGSQIQMAVIGPVVAPFETDEEGILVVPGGVEERDIDSPEELIKRRRRAVRRSRG